jgi:hypothetical protein
MRPELSIPPAAMAAERSVEMIRVWLAGEMAHVVLNVGFWEDRGLDERSAWGILLADMIHHIANAHESAFGHDPRESVARIRQAFEAERDNPTDERLGEFVDRRLGQDE